MAINTRREPHEDTSGALDNRSFDPTFDTYVYQSLKYNPATGALDRDVTTDAVDIRFDANDAAPDYIGINSSSTANTSDTDWLVYKYTYSGSDVTRIQRATGSWDGRAALF